MERQALQVLLDGWKEQYQLLLDQSATLLRNLDTWSPEEADELIARRQEIIDRLQNIDSSLQSFCEGGGRKANQLLLDQFRGFQQSATKRILELDAVVIALAKEQLDTLKVDLAGLSKRKTALIAYEKNGYGMGR